MDAPALAHPLFTALLHLEASEATTIMAEVLKQRPELAMPMVNVMVPDLTYAPVKAITERRQVGVVKMADAMGKGYGFISCPELFEVFGHDVFVHRKQLVHCYPGQEVNFAVLLNKENKPQAFDIVEGRSKDGEADFRGKGGRSGRGGLDDPGGGMCGQISGMGVGGMCGPMGGGMCGPMGGMGGMGGMGMMHGMGMMGNGMMMGMHGMGLPGMMGGMSGVGGCDRGGKGDGKGKRTAVLGTCIGVIKSWNQEKGYGFVTSQDIATYGVDGDAYLHVSQKGDYEVGSQVAFTLQLVNGRPQARDLRGPQDARQEGVQSEAGIGACTPAGRQDSFREQVLGTWIGTIKNYNHEKKFGFISCPELNAQTGVTGDVYLHDKVMRGFAAALLLQGVAGAWRSHSSRHLSAAMSAAALTVRQRKALVQELNKKGFVHLRDEEQSAVFENMLTQRDEAMGQYTAAQETGASEVQGVDLVLFSKMLWVSEKVARPDMQPSIVRMPSGKDVQRQGSDVDVVATVSGKWEDRVLKVINDVSSAPSKSPTCTCCEQQ